MYTRITVDGCIPAGNIVVDSIADELIRVHQDLRDTEGDWFYWKFRVCGAAGKEIRIEFTKSEAVGTRGPAISLDKGITWQWLGREATVERKRFSYFIPNCIAEAWFCFCIPYLEVDLQRWLAQQSANSRLRRETLCLSRQGRPVELLRVFSALPWPRFCVALSCRHHCCEAMANFALEGFLDAALADDDLGRWYAQNAEVIAIPFVDKDGVEAGDQGKNRKPRDHGRDYQGESIYPETAAIRQLFCLLVSAAAKPSPWICIAPGSTASITNGFIKWAGNCRADGKNNAVSDQFSNA